MKQKWLDYVDSKEASKVRHEELIKSNPDLNWLFDESKESFWEDLKYDIEYYLNKVINFFRDLTSFIHNLYYYSRTLWRVRDWDYGFHLMMEKRQCQLALKRYTNPECAKHMSDERREEIIRYLKILISILDRMEDEDWTETKVNVRNGYRFVNKDIYNDYIKRDDWFLIRVLVREEKLWHLYHLVRRNKLRIVWD